ncbi:MAG: hypothetical protein ACYTBJ_15365 [Planctomycetota bacterium]|jgi:hypothetical protein
MSILKDAVAEIVDELQTISGIRRVPDDPPENNDQFPFAVVYPLTGLYTQGPAVLMKGLHSVNIELHVSRKDLPRDFKLIMDLIDEIPYELMKLLNDGGYTNLSTIGEIEYTFGPLSWAGVDTLGVTYTITDVKVEREIT